MVRRFIIGWWAIILIGAAGIIWQVRASTAPHLVLHPQRGGSYSEAVVGTVKNLNPILPEGSASADANRLIFSGLTKFNSQGAVVPDLATEWKISPDGKTYTFKLREGVKWHDGVPFTAQDVEFTLTAIQNPDTRSPLASSWQGVRVGSTDPNTVVFTLPKPYAPFLNATTVGLLPRHMLENTEPSTLRVATFNQKPVGTGPYRLQQVDSMAGAIVLRANEDYYKGRPYINEITLRLYGDSDKAFDAYSLRQVQGVGRLQPENIDDARESGTLKIIEAGVPDEVAVFLKTTSPQLADKNVRSALAHATDRQEIIKKEFNNLATPLSSPLLPSSLKISGAPRQPKFNKTTASTLLDTAGWRIGRDGVRAKGETRLVLDLVTQSGTSYEGVAKILQKQWGDIGVRVNISAVDASTLQQSHIRTRKYDALLYGINVGADPDVYAYWDSSQVADPGLNLSVYKSPAADQALQAGRTINDPVVRAAKYKGFAQAFVADTPAVMLYSPSYHYAIDSSVYGVKIDHLITPADRFNEVEKWSVKVKARNPSR